NALHFLAVWLEPNGNIKKHPFESKLSLLFSTCIVIVTVLLKTMLENALHFLAVWLAPNGNIKKHPFESKLSRYVF
ncbi:MAG: hypothetical protein IJF07_04195, partial [Lachnospiraceae bacterium]|nr:hypothetical protein [Lachnospiraceae bacterium]